jgi:RNA polymerase sigma-70 factor (ECF subfamily)
MITEQEFTEKFKTHAFLTRNVLLRKFNVPVEDLDDVVNESWAKAWLKRDQYRGEAEFHTWVITIAINEWRTIRRKRQKGIRKELSLDIFTVSHSTQIPDESAWKGDDDPIKVMEDLGLSQVEIDLMVEFYLNGMTIAELAEKLDVNEDTLKVRLFRIRQYLKLRLAGLKVKKGKFGFKA